MAGLAVCNGDIHVVLFTALIDREAFKGEHPAWGEVGFDRAGKEDG